ncbi:hypothetical protein KAFR_0B01970 [Kazachstania africana CBS 2517]|uniref:Uncharacterized protein n=1 Tax=Kazachstania africana (strain ATCC 22294 / BCRC 22015 / CBS 2517 / CECT 1963 / NBRC 1671 / NRRL Y-8276) TaxID=1071382 RepID=H2AQ45_KAZAF|nr:hypothetical protein KAFR_0B01970 [Kazachstania africana CBS 2517]CCF56495.1 hypothetical protein KAFR_0B01970 [Kazachstania africana CBS 2517]
MRSSQVLLNVANKKVSKTVPIELTPLFLAVSVALCSGAYFTYRKFAYDDSLRVTANPQQSGLNDILKENEKDN